MSTIKKRLVTCPNCKKLSEYSLENAFRPFCSERCKMIDLGVWATEGYAIPVAINAADLSDDETNALLEH
ncbi:MAG: DNA gyrase inhibitor YacG [Methylotenera sp.]|jgi:endogenous inhibitor of DNA gyrase (YacG/DUF329 family)|nr:DNA gyrase inhibitor YacG [Methylotenera sp.]HPH07624.1 DNA gyrase inhibitor YacG [Methylotenera sp.]HPM49621.1 DNA gyrase inhibitor YacG [Methylotenera sp.]